MSVVKYNEVHLDDKEGDGLLHVSMANVVGEGEGWDGYTMRVFRVAPGGHSPLHEHDWEHVNHVIKGRGKLRLGDEVHDLDTKDFACVPPNVRHQFENPYDEDFEFICIVPNRGAGLNYGDNK